MLWLARENTGEQISPYDFRDLVYVDAVAKTFLTATKVNENS